MPFEFIRVAASVTKPRFRCTDPTGEHSAVIPVEFELGEPASSEQLSFLRRICGAAFDSLQPLFEACNGASFHVNGESAGLVIPEIADLLQLNRDWREWLRGIPQTELHPFQREGFAFATIAQSGNYFVWHDGHIYYGNHDGGDDGIFAATVEELVRSALERPAKFLYDVGCYTRYFDDEAEHQFIPEEFLSD